MSMDLVSVARSIEPEYNALLCKTARRHARPGKHTLISRVKNRFTSLLPGLTRPARLIGKVSCRRALCNARLANNMAESISAHVLL